MAQQVQLLTTTEVTSQVPGTTNVTTFYGASPNTPPVLNDFTVTFGWNSVYTFSQAGIEAEFSDVDSDGLFAMQVVSLPLLGTLTLNGLNVSIGQLLSLTDMNNLKFIPQANQFGSEYDSFLVRVKDNGIAPNLWSDNATITFAVTKDNVEPTVSDDIVTIFYEGTYTFNLLDLLVDYNDAEGDSFGYVEFPSIPAVGKLYLDGVPLTTNDVPLQLTAADFSAQRLKFTDDGQIIAQKDILIDYTVFDNI